MSSFINNKRRQLIGYHDKLADTFKRLKEHLQLSSYIDVRSVENIASLIGNTSLVHIQAGIDKAEQSILIAENLLQALMVERKYLEAQRQVSKVLLICAWRFYFYSFVLFTFNSLNSL